MNDADRLELPPIGPEELSEMWDAIDDEYVNHYDRSGNPISMRDWARLKEFGGLKYVAVKQEHVGPYWVSTVWIGLDHSFQRNGFRPLIFETMVFRRNDGTVESDLDMDRYSTEEEALAGHEAMVEKVGLFAQLQPEKAPTHSEE